MQPKRFTVNNIIVSLLIKKKKPTKQVKSQRIIMKLSYDKANKKKDSCHKCSDCVRIFHGAKTALHLSF